MMKLTQKQYQAIVEEQGKEVADNMASILGVANARIGKMQYAPKEVLQAWDTFQDAVRDNLSTWNREPTSRRSSYRASRCEL